MVDLKGGKLEVDETVELKDIERQVAELAIWSAFELAVQLVVEMVAGSVVLSVALTAAWKVVLKAFLLAAKKDNDLVENWALKKYNII